tara:strand:+ start:7528 stop:8115 length:588 start_codon:yes stop_codon:yes gene_type:complete
MKLQNILLLLLSISFLGACNADSEENTAQYQLKDATKSIAWTAYKTTDKVPVNGVFKTIDIISNAEGNTIKETLQALEFSLPVASLFADGKEYNVINFFFGVLLMPDTILGKINLTDDKNGYIDLTVGGITEKLFIEYIEVNNEVTITSRMDLQKWKLQQSIESLNKVCGFLHAGGDGIIKVWDHVDIITTVTFN